MPKFVFLKCAKAEKLNVNEENMSINSTPP